MLINRRFLAILSFLVILILIPQMLYSAKVKYTPDIDTRSIVTDVNQSARTVTVTSINSKVTTVYTLADPKWYKIEIIIDGQQKTFSSVVTGLQYLTSLEVQAGVVSSMTFCTAKDAPK